MTRDARTIDRDRKRGLGWNPKNKPGGGRKPRILNRVDKSIRMPAEVWHFLEGRYGGPESKRTPGDNITDLVEEVRGRELARPRKPRTPARVVVGVLVEPGDAVYVVRLVREPGGPWKAGASAALVVEPFDVLQVVSYLADADIVAVARASLPTDLSRNASADVGGIRGQVVAAARLLGGEVVDVKAVRIGQRQEDMARAAGFDAAAAEAGVSLAVACALEAIEQRDIA